MSSQSLGKELSQLPWTNTRQALNSLRQLLLCNKCHLLPNSPQYMGRCDHFFCESCMEKLSDNACPLCQIPSSPCDRKPDIVVRGLVYSVTEMLALIDGGEVPVKPQSLEAPESSNCMKYQSDFPSNKTPIVTRNYNKENVVEKQSRSTSRLHSTNIPKPQASHSAKRVVKRAHPTTSAKKSSVSTSKAKKPVNTPLSSIKNDIPNKFETPKTPQSLSDKSGNSSTIGVTPVTPAVNKRNMKGETPLHIASIKHDVPKVRVLLNDGANPNTKDNAGWTPLHEACSQGFEDIATLLLEHGALVDVPGSNNMTPLHDAVLTETVPVISLLRRWGASDTMRDIWGRSARSLADLTRCPRDVHAALDTPKDSMLIPKATLGPLQTRIVILDSNLSPEQRKKLEKVSKILKGKLVSEFSPDVTHIVVGCDEGSKICKRSIKYMMGVAAGKWIVSHQWLDACLSIEGPVNPVEYEVEGTRNNPCSLAPSKGRYNASKMLPGLFSGCHVFFYGSPGEQTLPSKKELEALITAGDGIVLHREPNPESINEGDQTVPFYSLPRGILSKCSHYCIYHEGVNEPQLKYDMAHIKSLPLSWIYDCIDHCSLVDPVK